MSRDRGCVGHCEAPTPGGTQLQDGRSHRSGLSHLEVWTCSLLPRQDVAGSTFRLTEDPKMVRSVHGAGIDIFKGMIQSIITFVLCHRPRKVKVQKEVTSTVSRWFKAFCRCSPLASSPCSPRIGHEAKSQRTQHDMLGHSIREFIYYNVSSHPPLSIPFTERTFCVRWEEEAPPQRSATCRYAQAAMASCTRTSV